jgi:CHAD domain-containing protein
MTRRQSTNTVLKVVVRQRLQDVARALKAAQAKTLSPKTLHVLRVGCRRTEAALESGRDVLPAKPLVWFRKHLRRLRQSCNLLRDDDVLLKWLKTQKAHHATRGLLETIRRQRQANQPQIAELAKALTHGGRFVRHAKRLYSSAKNGRDSGSWRRAVARRLFEELHHFVLAFPNDSANATELHRLRIAVKRLRYTIEFVEDIWPESKFTELKKLLIDMQDRLGRFHDAVVRQQRLAKLSAGNSSPTNGDIPTSSAQELQQLHEAWKKWWPARPVERIMARSTAEIVQLLRA